ncbi:DUF1127 domain-containing protein [Halomonas dongshanensis]|uniref:DUF1127 domain-containing protein n=1 Tax=Halomonas dongshanensis TaxID=2890835 RepID=A0ABT2EGJ6_9GAMM|nr:DUF1127 domain-containing protein [Halomonas dongshanensis]MCS2610488.1 DUF1127 domain-containing protein [Halomonas dongshanensis]
MRPFSLSRLLYRLRDYQELRRSRRQLLTLNDRLLRDIGISRAQAHKEGHKHCWRSTSFDKRCP